MIDWAQVSELREEVGADDFEEVVQLFLAEVDDVVSILQTGTDRHALEAQLHFLRGSALSLGFKTFCSICLEAEHKAALGTVTSEDLSEVLFAYFNAKTEFVEGLSATPDSRTSGPARQA